MKKNNLILLIKNQMSDNQKNEDALHLNTLLLSSIENPSIDNDCFIELFSYYSNISQGEVSELFNLLQYLTKNEINIIYDFLEYISKFIKDLGLCCEFENFLTEVKYIQERNYLEEQIGPTFPVFKVDKNIQNEFGENAVRIAINSSSENKEKIVKLLNNFNLNIKVYSINHKPCIGFTGRPTPTVPLKAEKL